MRRDRTYAFLTETHLGRRNGPHPLRVGAVPFSPWIVAGELLPIFHESVIPLFLNEKV